MLNRFEWSGLWFSFELEIRPPNKCREIHKQLIITMEFQSFWLYGVFRCGQFLNIFIWCIRGFWFRSFVVLDNFSCYIYFEENMFIIKILSSQQIHQIYIKSFVYNTRNAQQFPSTNLDHDRLPTSTTPTFGSMCIELL